MDPSTAETVDVHQSLPEPVDLDVPERLTAEQIRQAPDVTEELVPVPEWGGAVLMRSIDLDTAMRLGTQATDAGGMRDAALVAKLTLVAMCVDLDESAVEWLGQKSPVALKRLMEAMRRLQGITAEEVATAAATFPDAAGAALRAPLGGALGDDDR
jgi:hypothetical protein